ncbi:hypothetical protein FRC09_009914 [Ceratobasidium sp. 395]|nr:hypothetical protein FRC09_009914 [Ceratobasidium sp. 395]
MIAALCHFAIQGILIALLPNALSKGQQAVWQTRAYVVGINTMALTHTIVMAIMVLSNRQIGPKVLWHPIYTHQSATDALCTTRSGGAKLLYPEVLADARPAVALHHALSSLVACNSKFRLWHRTSKAHNGVFTTIWNVIWTAAAPPLAVMLVVMVDGYMVPDSDHGWATFFTNLSGKVYALSIMITLAG